MSEIKANRSRDKVKVKSKRGRKPGKQLMNNVRIGLVLNPTSKNDLPVDVMLRRMHFNLARAMSLQDSLDEYLRKPSAEVNGKEVDKTRDQIDTYLARAGEAAADAAPFIHPRLTSVEHSGHIGNKEPELRTLEEVEAEFKRRGLPPPRDLMN
jgi:hypothetical protein